MTTAAQTPDDGRAFLAYVAQVLVPTLRKRDKDCSNASAAHATSVL